MEPSERSEKRHRLIQHEFRSLGWQASHPSSADAIVVLSAPPTARETDRDKREKNSENRARVDYALELAQKLGVTKLMLNGDSEQIEPMKEIVGDRFPTEGIVLVDAGSRKTANTKTQFEAINQALPVSQSIVLTSSLYHVPRAGRTANKNLRPDIRYTVVGVPFSQYPFNVFEKVRGEVNRILIYEAKGDISESPCR